MRKSHAVFHQRLERARSAFSRTRFYSCHKTQRDQSCPKPDGGIVLIPSVRKIHNVNSWKVIGRSFSPKMGVALDWESTLERDWLLCLDGDPAVRAFGVQPRAFNYLYEGGWHRYTPDVEVHWAAADELPTIYEVKPLEVASSPSFKQKAATIGAVVKAKGYRFEVVTETEIRAEPRLSNLRFLKYYSAVDVTNSERDMVSHMLEAQGACSLQVLSHVLADTSVNLATLYRLLWDGYIRYAPGVRISPDTIVFPSVGRV